MHASSHADIGHMPLRLFEWLEAKIEVGMHFVSHTVPEAISDFAERANEIYENWLANLKVRQIQEHILGVENHEAARGMRAMSRHLVPLRPQPETLVGRLLGMLTRGSTPAPAPQS